MNVSIFEAETLGLFFYAMKHLSLPETAPRRLPFYLAMEEWAAKFLPPQEYFFNWRVSPTVICGRHQNIALEVDVDYCYAHGIDIVRRKSGGGCVYADMDNWMFSYISPSNDISSTFGAYTTMIVRMLDSLGIESKATGRNDIVSDGKKIAGNAYYHLPGRSIVHGTLLYDIDSETISRAITPSRSKLESKAVQSVPMRVGCLKRMGLKLTVEELGDYAISHLTESSIILTPENIRAIEEIELSYYDPDFIEGRRQHRTAEGQALKRANKRFEGLGEIDITYTLTQANRIADIALAGDYFLAGDPEDICSALRGVELNAEAIESALDKLDIGSIIIGMTNEKLIETLMQ